MTTNTDGIAQASAAPLPADPITSFFSTILEPGSSLHPTFLLIVDGAFLFLVLTLLSLAFVTSGNIHILALTVLSLGLWGSVKWFVTELQKVKMEEGLNEQKTPQEKKDE